MTLLYRRLTDHLKHVNDVALKHLDLLALLGDFQVSAFRADLGAVKGAVSVVRAGHGLTLSCKRMGAQ